MNITGLTGHSGSGKTTVAKILSAKGFYHIDCDRLVHEKIYTDKNVLKEIADTFGKIYVKDGVLVRKEFSKLIFSDKSSYQKLMKMIYPHIINVLNTEMSNSDSEYILLDAPTLFEFGLESICNQTVGVVSSKAVERICKRDGISIDDANRRLSHQKEPLYYKEKCDYTIENDGGLEMLEIKADEIADSIMGDLP